MLFQMCQWVKAWPKGEWSNVLWREHWGCWCDGGLNHASLKCRTYLTLHSSVGLPRICWNFPKKLSQYFNQGLLGHPWVAFTHYPTDYSSHWRTSVGLGVGCPVYSFYTGQQLRRTENEAGTSASMSIEEMHRQHPNEVAGWLRS